MKRMKILIDVCMVILLFLLFPTARFNPVLHIILGYVFISIAVIHVLLNGKWLIGVIKKLFSGKLNSKALYMFMLVVGLIIAFFACIYSGIIVYRSDVYQSLAILDSAYRRTISDPFIMFMYRLHSLSAIACVFLTFLHAIIHWGYIKSFSQGKSDDGCLKTAKHGK